MSKRKDLDGFLKFCEMMIKRKLNLKERILLTQLYNHPDSVICPPHKTNILTPLQERLLLTLMSYENMKNTLSD